MHLFLEIVEYFGAFWIAWHAYGVLRGANLLVRKLNKALDETDKK